jgi:DNA-binding LacI/PurR family transcriptional regulator
MAFLWFVCRETIAEMASGLNQIARETGVAVSTVSRALAGKPGVSPARREQILSLAARMGYVPDTAASTLRTGRGTGLVVVTQFRPVNIVSRRNNALFHHGKETFGHTRVLTLAGSEMLDHAVRQALAQKCRAIVVSSVRGVLEDETVGMLHRARVPLAVVDGNCNTGDQLVIDRSVGTYQCARLLLLNGCRSIRILSNADLASPDPRLSGIIRGFESLGRALTPEMIVAMDAGPAGGYEAMRGMLSRDQFDGVFCYSDDTAIGALRALSEAQVRVPQDVQIVGFDDVEHAAYGAVPLTTVAQPVDEIARTAVELCAARADNYREECQVLTFPTELVARASAPIVRHEIRAQVFASADAETART